MKCKILICELIKDSYNEVLLGTHDIRGNYTVYFDMPREDLRKCKDARIKITISEMEVTQ